MALSKKFNQTVNVYAETEMGRLDAGEMNLTKDLYIKVVSVQGTKETVAANVTFSDTSKTSVYEFTPDLNGGNFIKQAYEHLKTLPEFSDAIDV